MDVVRTKSPHALCLSVIVYHHPWKDGYQCDIHIMANLQKEKEEMTKSFQNTFIWVQRLFSPFPVFSKARGP